MGWGGLVSVPWGGGPWGLGHSIASVSPGQVPDEGGIEIEILGSFAPGIRATVTVAGADCPYPSALGGADAANTIGAGAFPVASGDGTRICAIVPQTTVGWHDLTVQQPGLPLLTLAGAIETVRRDWWTRLHTLRNAFPAPPFSDKTIGARRLELEGRYGQVTEEGQPVPVLEGLLHSLAGALLEASATLYTRLAAAPFRSGSVAQAASTSLGDGQVCTIHGRDLAGNDVSESVTLAGWAWVSTTQVFSEVTWAELDTEAAGTILILDDTGAQPGVISIFPGFRQKAAGALQEGDTVVVVEGNYRFPDSGWLALAGERQEYYARVCSASFNFFYLGATPPAGGGIGGGPMPLAGTGAGVTLPHDCGEMVADAANIISAVELGRRMMLPEFSEGRYLSAVARRWGGIERPGVPLTDDLFRALFAAVSYGPRGTLRILTLLLDAIVGAGFYEIIEDPVNFSESWVGGTVSRVLCSAGHPCTVFVNWGALLLGGNEQGKAFLCGGEPQTSTGFTTVDTAWSILLPYGVYTAADLAAGLGRTNNYCDFYSPAGDGSGPGAPPDEYNSAGGLFLPADDGKDLEISGSAAAYEDGVFRVTYSDAWTVFLSGVPRAHGTVVGGSLDVFTVDTAPAALGVPFASCPFGPDDVGKLVTVLDTMAGAPVTRTIGEYIDKRRVRMTVPWPAACTDASWCFSPQPWGGASNWRIARGSAAGSTITLARALPGAATAVVCDYTAVRSAMIPLRSSESHAAPTAARPFYLSDSGAGAWLLQLLDDLTVAGVIPEAGDPHA